MFFLNYVGSVYAGGYGGLSESSVFRDLCPIGFLVGGESPPVCCSL